MLSGCFHFGIYEQNNRIKATRSMAFYFIAGTHSHFTLEHFYAPHLFEKSVICIADQ